MQKRRLPMTAVSLELSIEARDGDIIENPVAGSLYGNSKNCPTGSEDDPEAFNCLSASRTWKAIQPTR